MLEHVHTAMVLCAGFGKRMEELSLTCPKPLLPVWGKPMLDHLLARLQEAGIKKLVVNTHHLADQFNDYFQARTNQFDSLVLTQEQEILGIAGGIRNVLPHLGSHPFFVINGDVMLNPQKPLHLFQEMEQKWDQNTDALLAVVPYDQAWGYEGKGDFFLSIQDHLTLRETDHSVAPYVYGGIQLMRPEMIERGPNLPHLLPFWKKALVDQRLKGIIWEGIWLHVGTKAAYEAVQNL